MRSFLISAVLLGLAGAVTAQTHPSQLPELGPDTVFPRCTPEELAAAGFPDHLHAYWWPGWQVKTGSDGLTYGPGSLCDHKELLPREGLVVGEAEKRFGNFVVLHNPQYRPCEILPLLELLQWAFVVNQELLGLTSTDTLTVENPDNVASYRELTGQDVWRFFQIKGDKCILQPYGTLQARTLEGHACFMLVTDWLLQKNCGMKLPRWLHQGLAEYLAEDGVHLVNYMGQFRSEGQVLFSAPLINVLLAGGADPDPGRDREMYRRACYSAFLMVWRLVEDEGGLDAMRHFLGQVTAGVDPDEAAREIYGADLNELALRLDPVKLGEPVGDATQSRRPHVQP